MATKRRRGNDLLSAPAEAIGEVVKQTSRITGEVIERASSITDTAQDVTADWAETISPEAARLIRPSRQQGRQRSAAGAVKRGVEQSGKSASRATKAAGRAASRSAKSVTKAATRSTRAKKKGSAKAGQKKRTKK